MKGSLPRTGAAGPLLGACLALVGCTGSGEADDPTAATDDPTDAGVPADLVPDEDEDDASTGPNFEFSVGEAYRDDPSTPPAFVASLEDFFAGALAPLQRIPGLMPRTVSVVYDRCGSANAFHDGATATITLCHEFSEYAYELFTDGVGDPRPNDAPPDPELATSRVLEAMGFVMYHEIGHAMDYQLDLPLAGNVESNIDGIATVISVETGRPLYAITGAILFRDQPPSFTGVHGGGADRAGDIGCWTTGGDPSARAALTDPGITDLFTITERDCTSEYAGQRDTVRRWMPELGRLDADSSRRTHRPARPASG